MALDWGKKRRTGRWWWRWLIWWHIRTIMASRICRYYFFQLTCKHNIFFTSNPGIDIRRPVGNIKPNTSCLFLLLWPSAVVVYTHIQSIKSALQPYNPRKWLWFEGGEFAFQNFLRFKLGGATKHRVWIPNVSSTWIGVESLSADHDLSIPDCFSWS